jgi:hypothetical protein
MGKLTAQLQETTYSFPGVIDEEVRFEDEDEDDEVRTTVSHRSCGSSK